MILPGTGRGTSGEAGGGGGSTSLRRLEVYTARKLRRQLSLPEAMLWKRMQRQQCGFKVRRQHPIPPYIVDFFVAEARLIIEVDGDAAHASDGQGERDVRREAFLAAKGFIVLRIAAAKVLRDIEGALEMIAAAVADPLHHASHGSPPRAGEDL